MKAQSRHVVITAIPKPRVMTQSDGGLASSTTADFSTMLPTY